MSRRLLAAGLVLATFALSACDYRNAQEPTEATEFAVDSTAALRQR